MSTVSRGFTLIELSIVLVIIGLIVGGILVGRNLIDAAAVRAQISQIEKYQSAANTFRGKYGYLPGDIPDPSASQFGFQSRAASYANGDGVLEGYPASINPQILEPFRGEEVMFWADLSAAGLVDGSFTAATPSALIPTVTGSAIGQYLPQSKIGNGGYIYVYSGGMPAIGYQINGDNAKATDQTNYFGLATITAGWGPSIGTGTLQMPLLTVAQAYAIDKKMDDGLPQYGNVTAIGIRGWAAGGAGVGSPANEPNYGDYDYSNPNYGPIASGETSEIGGGTAQGPTSCYDGGIAPNYLIPEQYSVGVNNGAGVNCWLSFRFQ